MTFPRCRQRYTDEAWNAQAIALRIAGLIRLSTGFMQSTALPKLEQRIDKRCNRRPLGEDDQTTE